MQPGRAGTSAKKTPSSSLQKMEISYLCIGPLPERVPLQYSSNLPDLIRFGITGFPLEVDQLRDAGPSKDMVSSPNALLESELEEELSEVSETNVGIRAAGKHAAEQLLALHL
jgi:hypothetical protein